MCESFLPMPPRDPIIDWSKPLHEQLTELAKCEGIGRDVLERRIALLAKLVQIDVAPHLDNLQAVQKRCTKLLEEMRALRALVQELCPHGAVVDTMPAHCTVCGKEMP